MVGRAWPRHGHRGRPFNSVVSLYARAVVVFVNPDPTFGHQADRVFKLYQLAADIRDKYAAGETDTRRVSLNNVAMVANAGTATLRLLDWAKKGGEETLTKALGLAKPGYVNFVAEDLLRSSRLCLLVETQFQIETAFRNILAALGKFAPKLGFYNLAQELLATASTPDAARKLQVLNIAALMGNSMHANGIHHGWKSQNTIETVNGAEFRFEHGQRIQCGSWFHIVTALTASLEILDAIFNTPAVRAIANIPDSYAEQKEAAKELSSRGDG